MDVKQEFISAFLQDPDNEMLYFEIEEINRRDPRSEPVDEFMDRIIAEHPI